MLDKIDALKLAKKGAAVRIKIKGGTSGAIALNLLSA